MPALQLQRRNFSNVQQLWRSLTAEERASWSSLLGVWTFKNKFGDVYNGTPFQIYSAVSLNLLSLDTELTPIAPTPAEINNPIISFDAYSIGGTFNINVGGSSSESYEMLVKATRPLPPTAPPSLAHFGNISNDRFSGEDSYDLKSHYDATIGYPPLVGQVFYVKVFQTNRTYPRMLNEFIQKVIITA